MAADREFDYGPSRREEIVELAASPLLFFLLLGGVVIEGSFLATVIEWGGIWPYVVGYLGLAMIGPAGMSVLLCCAAVRTALRRQKRRNTLKATPEGLALSDGVFVIPYQSVVWAGSDARMQREGLVIVFGRELRTWIFWREWFDPQDYEDFGRLVRDRMPHASTPDPPTGWRPPEYDWLNRTGL